VVVVMVVVMVAVMVVMAAAEVVAMADIADTQPVSRGLSASSRKAF